MASLQAASSDASDDLVYGYPTWPPSWERVVLPVDKPKGWSSFDVIRKLRKVLGIRKIGHAGTLDPMATGLLICLVGRATKLMESFMHLPKTYTGTLRLGEVTPSYDAETEVTERMAWTHVTDEDLEHARKAFLGEITQRPPMYSAIKVGGERLYKKARRGEVVERPPRTVRIDAFTLTGRDGADVSFRVQCSKGTYVRSRHAHRGGGLDHRAASTGGYGVLMPMKREYGLEQIERDDASCVTVGTFDGVHVGHQAILRYLLRRAEAQGCRSVVVTFDPHPREVVAAEHVPLLTTIDERAEAMEALGLDRFIVVPFTQAFSRLPPEAFVEDVLVERIGLSEIVVGYDHGFGRGRQGDRALLEELGKRHGFTVDVISPQEVEHHVVSSSEIRQLLAEEGNVALAAEMLGRPYTLTGTVVHGDHRGKTIGYPTANLDLVDERKVVPRRGVYAVRGQIEETTTVFGGMMNIGLRPTFNGTEQHLEAHLFELERDIYGQRLRIEFVERIRDEHKFESVDALVEQLSQDESRCKRALEAVS